MDEIGTNYISKTGEQILTLLNGRIIEQRVSSVKITTSVYPVPMICRVDQLDDWFSSLADILHWNLRKPQSKLSPERHDRINDDSSSSSDENKAEDGLRSSSVSASETSVDNEA